MYSNDTGTEADYLYTLEMEDVTFDDSYENVKSLNQIRNRRKQNLIGKYVIVCNGIKSKKLCYLQDRNISKKGFWTNFISNAIGFENKNAALNVLKNLKYNKPKIKLIDSKFNLVDVQ